jgi:hypothetical protein
MKIYSGQINVEALTGNLSQIKEATVVSGTTSSSSWTDLLTSTFTTAASNLLAMFSAGDCWGSNDGCIVQFQLLVDGVVKTGAIYGVDGVGSTSTGGDLGGQTDSAGEHEHNYDGGQTDSAGDHDHSFSIPAHEHAIEIANWRIPAAIQKFVTVAAGTHTVKIQWRRTGAGTAYIGSTFGAQLTIVEFRKSAV